MDLLLRLVKANIVLWALLINNAIAQTDGTGVRIAVVDSGILSSELGFYNSFIYDQLCFSLPDNIGNDLDFTGNVVGLCKNGVERDLTSSDAAVVPRYNNINNIGGTNTNYKFASPHGSAVLGNVTASASGAKVVIVNTSYFDMDRDWLGGDGLMHDCPLTINSSVYSDPPNECYGFRNGLADTSTRNKIKNLGVSVINMSNGIIGGSCSENNDIYSQLKDDNIAVIAAAGNADAGELGSNTRVAAPACNRYVISVGAAAKNGNFPASYSSEIGHIDFYASGVGFDPDTTGELSGTSYAAPIVSAAFAHVKQLNPTSSINEIKFALGKTAANTIDRNGVDVPIITRASMKLAAQCLQQARLNNTGDCVVPDNIEDTGEVGFFDGNEFGDAFGGEDIPKVEIEINLDDLLFPLPQQKLDSGSSQKSVDRTVSTRRDLVVKFLGKTINNQSNKIGVRLNNGGLSSKYQGSTFNGEMQHTITINRYDLNEGSNILSIEPSYQSRSWGVKDISVEFTSIVPLSLGVTATTDYGSEEADERPTGMRASFELDSLENDVTFDVTGWDISDSTEVAVFLNGKEYGHLSYGGNFSYNNGDQFLFEKEDLVEGVNVIEFVQKQFASRWGVKDLLVKIDDQPTTTLQLGTINQNQFGSNYGSNENPYQLTAIFTPQNEHDHIISWRMFDVDQTNEVEVYLNNTRIKSVNTTTSNALGATESVTLAWRLFQAGENTLSFRVNTQTSDGTWGVTSLLAKTSTIIDLDRPTNLGKDYGYYTKQVSQPSGWNRTYSQEGYQTRLYATFNKPSTGNKTVKLTGWDIDSPTEIAVYLNGALLQNITHSANSSGYSNLDELVLSSGSLLQGTNTLLFKHQGALTGFQNEKWGIKFDGGVNMAPIIMSLLDDE